MAGRGALLQICTRHFGGIKHLSRQTQQALQARARAGKLHCAGCSPRVGGTWVHFGGNVGTIGGEGRTGAAGVIGGGALGDKLQPRTVLVVVQQAGDQARCGFGRLSPIHSQDDQAINLVLHAGATFQVILGHADGHTGCQRLLVIDHPAPVAAEGVMGLLVVHQQRVKSG